MLEDFLDNGLYQALNLELSPLIRDLISSSFG